MIFAIFFFVFGIFWAPFPFGLVASLAGGAIGTYLVKDRYLETKCLAGDGAYYKVLAFSFIGTTIVYFVATCLGYGLSLLFGN